MSTGKGFQTKRCICSVCQIEKTKIAYGTFKADKSHRRFLDYNGRQWNGNCCPTCHANRVKVNMRIKRAKDKENPPDV